VARIDLFAYAIAVVICTAAAAAIAGHLLRPYPRDGLLLWFGVFSAIYGVRMFFKPPLASALAVPLSTGRWIASGLDYFILIPGLLFIEQLYGLGWRQLLRWVTIAMSVFAVVALITNIISGEPGRVPEPSIILLLIVGVIIVIGWRSGYRPYQVAEWPVLVAGVGIFMLFVINEHAVGAGVVPWRISAEPLGFLVQIACFGYIALTHVFTQGRQLAAVHQEMRSAREIQEAILPRGLPALRNVQIAARYVPLAAVAGDLYDTVALGDRALAVLVADVSGHGVPAALIASMVKVAFTAGCSESDDPGVILQRMNATLCGMFERSFVTAATAVLRPDQGVLSYAVAGHPPPLLLPPSDGRTVPLEHRGIVLGFMPSAVYSSATLPIEPGARLILYSDGVIETPAPDGDLYGLERLSAFASCERQRPCDSFADALMDTLRRFARRSTLPHDDVTFVVVDMAGSL
jgi:sigma-B regulation protein RsbU (phosphoserine phosphatase)